jgi:hypothetical protein
MSDDYSKYLQSEHWLRLAKETKRIAGNRCQVCNSPDELCAHHRTYERRGHELQSDLICLCRDCHEMFHEKGKYEKTFHERFTTMEKLAPIFIVPSVPTSTESLARPARIITVKLSESEDEQRDIRRLKNIHHLLMSRPGKDKLCFDIDGRIIEYLEGIDITELQLKRLGRLIETAGSWIIDESKDT